MAISGWGYLDSDGHFDLSFYGAVGLPSANASTGIVGNLSAHASFDGTTFAFSVSGTVSARFCKWNVASLGVGLYASGTLGQRLDLGLRISFKIIFVRISFTIHIGSIQLPGSMENSAAKPANLAFLDNGILTLNVGSLAQNRNLQPDQEDEAYTIEHVSGTGADETVLVTAFGESETFEHVSSITGDFGSGQDTFRVNAGVLASVSVSGGAGDDTLIYAGSGSAWLHGGDGDDMLTIEGAVSGVSLYGEAGANVLTGGTGANFLSGGDGDDVFVSGGGADAISGGAGDDSVIAYLDELGRGATFDGGAGSDQIQLLGSAAANVFRAASEGMTQVRLSSYSGNVETAYLLGSNVETLVMDGRGDVTDGEGGSETTDGPGGSDSFSFLGDLRQAGVTSVTVSLDEHASAAAVEIALGDGNDTLTLADYADTPDRLTATWVGHTVYNLLSVSANDTLTLKGGLGNDLLCGDTVTDSPFGQICFLWRRREMTFSAAPTRMTSWTAGSATTP